MTSKREAPLDEIQWHAPSTAREMSGIHSNSVLFYFAQSPFFDPTSNNAVLFSQGLHNPAMTHLLATREAFEARLRSMSGLEFVVAQEPAETGPDAGTGVWVIRKQTRRKRPAGEDDDVTVHAAYFVVGEHVYMAPSFADILSSRIVSPGPCPGGGWVRVLTRLIFAGLNVDGYKQALPRRAEDPELVPRPRARLQNARHPVQLPPPRVQGSHADAGHHGQRPRPRHA